MTVLGIIVDVILFLIIVGNAAMAYKQGLTRVIFNICSSILAIVLVFILYRPVTNFVYTNTKVAQNMEQAIQSQLDSWLPENATTESINNEENGLLKIFMGETGDFIQNSADSVEIYVASNITYRILSIIIYFALFTIIRLGLIVLKNYADFLANLPFVSVINHTGGMVYGVIRGFLIVYVVLAVISLLMPVIGDTVVIKAIEEAWIGSKMFYNNILLNVIFKFL